jgi:hypothetical protein
MHAHEPSVGCPPLDLPAPEAQRREVATRHHAVLHTREMRERGLQCTHTVHRGPRPQIRPPARLVVESIRHDVVVSVGRLAWITTVAVFVIAAICLFFSDYTGYAVLSLAVAASAAINLR